MGALIATWLDRMLYRRPFEGASARRYASSERPAFGDLDDRLLDGMTGVITAPGLRAGVRLLDLGSGPGAFAARAVARYPSLAVVAIDPSRDYARARDGVSVARGAGEALPLADRSIDVAMCLSSIRHVRDRVATLRELRRVVRPGGTLVIVELDPAASAARIATHANRLGSTVLRHAFGPLVVRTAPPAHAILANAVDAGWRRRTLRDDGVQPVYIMELV